jgi:hypothetical protein
MGAWQSAAQMFKQPSAILPRALVFDGRWRLRAEACERIGVFRLILAFALGVFAGLCGVGARTIIGISACPIFLIIRAAMNHFRQSPFGIGKFGGVGH